MLKCHPELASLPNTKATSLVTDANYKWFDASLAKEGCTCIFDDSQKTTLNTFNTDVLSKKPNLDAITTEFKNYKSCKNEYLCEKARRERREKIKIKNF